MSSLLMLRAPGALIFNSIVSHGIFGKCLESLLERELEGSLPFSLLPVPWLRSWPLFPPSETPLWCSEDPYPPPYERKGVMPIPALGWGEGASGKLGKVVGQSTVGNPGFREVWQDPWGATWAPSHARGGCFHLLAPRLPGPMSTSPFLDNPSLRSGFLPSIPWKAREGPWLLWSWMGWAMPYQGQRTEALAALPPGGCLDVALRGWGARVNISVSSPSPRGVVWM